MRNDDGSYDRYRQAEAELSEQLEERRRAAEDAADWERTRQTLREQGSLDWFESKLHEIRCREIKSARKRGKSLHDARLHADEVMARVRKALK